MASARGSLETEKGEREGRGEKEAGAPVRPLQPGSASPVPWFDVTNGRGRLPAVPPIGAPFTMRLKSGRTLTVIHRRRNTLQSFVAEMQQHALGLRNLVEGDERCPHGSSPTDGLMELDTTLREVRLSLGCCDHCVPDLEVVGVIPKFTKEPQGQLSSPSRPSTPSPPSSPERCVSIRRRLDVHPVQLTEADLESNPHLTLKEKAASLEISLSTLKKARRKLQLGKWRGKQERARLRRLLPWVVARRESPARPNLQPNIPK